ncbi:hypothetical protein LJC56_01680 [Christensenellaceae bacterium OttesenSCG-928-K19]|nr:hypothetical protein [Christensenellaceae bacterium OttesenSCG-928-K19]
MFPIVIGIVVAAVLVGVAVEARFSQARLEKRAQGMFGQKPDELSRFDLESIQSYYEAGGGSGDVDGITWADIDMDRVFARINNCATSAGEEYLYMRLHRTANGEGQQNSWTETSAYMEAHPDERIAVQKILYRTGKTYYNHVGGLIFQAKHKQLKSPWVYRILQLVPVACLPLAFINMPLGLVLAACAAVLNGAIHYKVDRRIEHELKAIRYLAAVLWGCGRLLQLKSESVRRFLPGLEDAYKKFKPVMKAMSGMSQNMSTDLDAILIYVRYIFLLDIIRYNRVIKKILQNQDEIRTLYESLGKIDTLVSVLSFRRSLESYAVPQFWDKKGISFRGLYHPLLEGAVANSMNTEKGCLVTGSNASGKSTFIKAVAVNCILAQAVYTCTAEEFNMAQGNVMTSMAVKDNIVDGESYFIAEIKSVKRIEEASSAARLCYGFIDEILRGTNTVERIAASVALLRRLGTQNILCMVATHDVELPELLDSSYGNYHFSERIENDEVVFDYKLKDGPSTTQNAIRLLGIMGFEKSVVQQAEELAGHYLSNHEWK